MTNLRAIVLSIGLSLGLAIIVASVPSAAGQFANARDHAVEGARFANTLANLGLQQAEAGNASASCYWYGRTVSVLYYSFVFGGLHLESGAEIGEHESSILENYLAQAGEPNYQEICEQSDLDPGTMKERMPELMSGLAAIKAGITPFLSALGE